MAESVYKVVELVGTSSDSWEKAAKAAVERAAKSLRDLRVAEVVEGLHDAQTHASGCYPFQIPGRAEELPSLLQWDRKELGALQGMLHGGTSR